MILFLIVLLFFIVGIHYFGNNKLTLCIIIAILFFVVRYRDINVGTDYSEYISFYVNYRGGFLDNFTLNYLGSLVGENTSEVDPDIARSYEPGWLFLVTMSKKFDWTYQNFQAFLFLIQVLTLAFCCRLMNFNLLHVLFFWYILFYYFAYFNITRQSLAMSFGLIFYCSILNARYLLAVTSLILSLCFHFTSLVMLFVIPIFVFPKIFKYKLFLIFFSTLIGMWSLEIITNINFINGYKVYADVEKISAFDLSLRSIYILLNIVLLFVVIHSTNEINKINFFNNIWMFSIILQIVLVNYKYGARLYEYFSVVSIFCLIPMFLGRKHSGRIKPMYVLVLSVTIILFLWNIFFNTYGVSHNYWIFSIR